MYCVSPILHTLFFRITFQLYANLNANEGFMITGQIDWFTLEEGRLYAKPLRRRKLKYEMTGDATLSLKSLVRAA